MSGYIDIPVFGTSSGGTTYTPPVPPQIQGLALWLDAGQGVTADGSNNVSKWIDQGPNGFAFSQSTGANQPLFVANAVNSNPIIRFYGNPSNLDADITNPAIFTTATSGWTLYTVFKHNGFGTNPEYQCPLFFPIALSASAERAWFLISNDSASYADISFGSGTTYVKSRSGSMGLSTTGFHTLKVSFDGVSASSLTSFLFSLDATHGTTVGNGGYGAGSTSGSFRIGARGDNSTYSFKADIAEIIWYSQAVSPSNDTKLRAYINGKYAI